MTNNPDKIEKLRELGVLVNGRIPTIVPSNPYSAGYLEAKRVRMAHDLPARGHAPGIVAAVSATDVRRRVSGDHG